MKSCESSFNEEVFEIPENVLRETKLIDAENLSALGTEGVLIIIDDDINATQIIAIVELIKEIGTELIHRLISRAKDQELSCRKINIPAGLLDMAGIPEGAPLDICAGDGELYITVLAEEEDPVESLPGFLRDILEDHLSDLGIVRHLLESEENINE